MTTCHHILLVFRLEFLKTLDNLPEMPGRPRLIKSKLVWHSNNYHFYSGDIDKSKGVVFLLLGSRVASYANGSIDERQLNWEFISWSFSVWLHIVFVVEWV